MSEITRLKSWTYLCAIFLESKTVFGKIFGPLLVLIVRILTAPAVLLAKIIAYIVNLINP